MKKRYKHINRIITAIATLCISLFIAGNIQAQIVFTVNSIADNGNQDPGDGTCFTGNILSGNVAECTFRAAIEEANAAGESVIIEFGAPIETNTYGISSIQIESSLPWIQNNVTIAGETHPDFVERDDLPTGGHPRVYIRGRDVNSSGIRFQSGGAGSTVRHISVGGFGNSGILLQGGNNYTLEGNLLGGFWSPNVVGFNGNDRHGIDVNGASEPGGGITNIRNNIVMNNGGNGIHIRNGSSATFIQNNIIGLRPNVVATDPFLPTRGNDGAGVYITEDAGPDNMIGAFAGNTISNNGSGGIHVLADNQTIFGNDIGLPYNGQIHPNYEASDYGNDSNGIILESSDNTVGGGGSATNTIGNSQYVGIRIGSGGNNIEANNNTIGRNFIGTNADGDDFGQSQGIRIDKGSDNEIRNVITAFNNAGIEMRSDNNIIARSTIRDNSRGIFIRNSSVLIGGDDLNDANTITENVNGIEIIGDSAPVLIKNNYIGTNSNAEDFGNSRGIVVDGEDTYVLVGTTGNGNIIGFNTHGIVLRNGASGTSIVSNYIGLHPNGQEIGNHNGISVPSESDAYNNQIGYPAVLFDADDWEPITGPGNIIAHNEASGVTFSIASDNSINNTIRGNSIFDNGTHGIDLGMQSVDVGGGSTGPNTMINFPEFDDDETFFNESTGEIELRYRVRTNTGNSMYDFGIDIFLADRDERQGKTFLGTVIYEEENATEWVFDSIKLPEGITISPRDQIVATTTDHSGNTSQFSELAELMEAEPEIAVSESSLNYGTVAIASSNTLSFEIKNDGNAELTGDVTLADDSDGAFSITTASGGFSLDADESLEVEVEFSPEREGEISGSLEISHNAENENSPVKIDLTGSGEKSAEPLLTVSQLELEFSSVNEGDAENLSFEVENQGDAQLEVGVYLADNANGVFSIAEGAGESVLDPSETMVVSVEFSPDDEGDFTGLIEIKHNAENESDPVEVILSGGGILTSSEELSNLPTEFSLEQNYPNPFNPVTQISYQLPEQADVTLRVFNILGQYVTTLVNANQSPGEYSVSFDASNLSSGTYIYRLEAGNYVETNTMMLLK